MATKKMTTKRNPLHPLKLLELVLYHKKTRCRIKSLATENNICRKVILNARNIFDRYGSWPFASPTIYSKVKRRLLKLEITGKVTGYITGIDEIKKETARLKQRGGV